MHLFASVVWTLDSKPNALSSSTPPSTRGQSTADWPLSSSVSFQPNTAQHVLVSSQRSHSYKCWTVPGTSCSATCVWQTDRQAPRPMTTRRSHTAVEPSNCAYSGLAAQSLNLGLAPPCGLLQHQSIITVLVNQRLVPESVHSRSQSNPLNRDNGSMTQVQYCNSLFKLQQVSPHIMTRIFYAVTPVYILWHFYLWH